jgi:predicted lactoylglutathione lyase
MSRMIFVNLPVADLPKSRAFYEAIGFANDPRFTDETAAGMTLSDAIHVMLLTHDKWRQFTSKAIPDARESAQVMLCISEDSRAGVDAITGKALAAGGKEEGEPDDYGFMYGRNFTDPDGHIWAPMWMDMAGFEAAAQQAEPAEA